MARHKLQSMKVLTGRTPHIYGHLMRDGLIDEIITLRNSNEVLLTDELKELIEITDSYDGNPPWLTHKSLPKRFLSWLSELRYKGSKR